MKTCKKLPLVYSCSGCSSAAQMANALAVRFDREQIAEMSCIPGVGGDVPSLVHKATDPDRKIIAIDGCPLACVENCLRRHNVVPNLHFILTELGVKKAYHADFDHERANRLYTTIKEGMDSLRKGETICQLTKNLFTK